MLQHSGEKLSLLLKIITSLSLEPLSHPKVIENYRSEYMTSTITCKILLHFQVTLLLTSGPEYVMAIAQVT
jgi:hypothetical protein